MMNEKVDGENECSTDGRKTVRSGTVAAKHRFRTPFRRRELGKENMRYAVRRVGRPWYNRKRRIPLWKINAYRAAGFSLRQTGALFGVSATTIKRRLQDPK